MSHKRGRIIQLTEHELPNFPILVGDGSRTIPYYDWLENEQARVLRDPNRVAQIRYKEGKFALYVDDVSEE